MERWVGKAVVVTGASAGIGENVARRLVQEGCIVVGLARRVEKVQKLAEQLVDNKGKLHALKCDVADKNEVTKCFDWVRENVGPVHILINNAGVAIHDTICEGDPENWKRILDTNVFGLAVCTHEAVKQMRENNIAGHIININSLAGHKVLKLEPPRFNMYSPSKYAVTALSDVLTNELAHFKAQIKVTSISPGLVLDTEVFEAGNFPGREVLPNLPHIYPQDVTNAIIYALSTPPYVQVHELTIKAVGESY